MGIQIKIYISIYKTFAIREKDTLGICIRNDVPTSNAPKKKLTLPLLAEWFKLIILGSTGYLRIGDSLILSLFHYACSNSSC